MEFIIESDIFAKPITKLDSSSFYNAIRRNRVFLSKYLEWSLKIDSEEKALQYVIEKTTGSLSETTLLLGIYHQENLIGSIELQHWNPEIKKAEIGFWIDQNYSHKGIMTKALKIFLNNGFHFFGLNKIYAIYLPDNAHCHQLLEKLGFKIEGILRDDAIHNGSLTNVVIAAKLKADI